jgi:hypothetical protein
MKTVGIAIDIWKREIFKRHLDEAGFTYEIVNGGASTLFLKVKAKTIAEVQKVVEAANKEAIESRFK